MKRLVTFGLAMQLSVSAFAALDATPSTLLKRANAPGDCQFEKCFTEQMAMERAGKFSFEAQEDMLDLFIARQNVVQRAGQLLPSFSYRHGVPLDPLTFIPNLLGFIFPHNWYRLAESKLHAKAQENSFVSLVANRKNMAQGMYLSTHRELIYKKSLESYIAYCNEVLDLMRTQAAAGKLAAEDIQEMEAFLNSLNGDVIVQKDMLSGNALDVAYTMNELNVLENPGPAERALPDLTTVPRINIKDHIKTVVEVAPELKSIEFLIAAARYSKRARGWEFLHPEMTNDSAFGLQWFANQKIEWAEIEKLKLEREGFEARLKKTLAAVGRQANSAIERYQYAASVDKSINQVLSKLHRDLETTAQVDVNRWVTLLKESYESREIMNEATHSYLQAVAHLNRLTMTGKEFQGIKDLIPKKNQPLACQQRKENKIIRTAIANGELKDLPEKLEFTPEEVSFCIR